MHFIYHFISQLVALVVVLIAILLLPLIGRAVLGPISRSAGALKAPTRFQLSDFVWLLVMIQAVLGGVVRFVGAETRGPFEVILAYLIFAVTGLWGGAISFLSRAGVLDPRRRAAFILVILPGTLSVMVGVPAGTVFVVLNLVGKATRYGGWSPQWQDTVSAIGVGVAASLAIAAVVYALRKAALWVASEAEVEIKPEGPAPTFDGEPVQKVVTTDGSPH